MTHRYVTRAPFTPIYPGQIGTKLARAKINTRAKGIQQGMRHAAQPLKSSDKSDNRGPSRPRHARAPGLISESAPEAQRGDLQLGGRDSGPGLSALQLALFLLLHLAAELDRIATAPRAGSAYGSRSVRAMCSVPQ